MPLPWRQRGSCPIPSEDRQVRRTAITAKCKTAPTSAVPEPTRVFFFRNRQIISTGGSISKLREIPPQPSRNIGRRFKLTARTHRHTIVWGCSGQDRSASRGRNATEEGRLL